VARGLEPALARQTSEQLMRHDAIAAHARDELSITAATRARPLQAAAASAGSFVSGASLPLVVAALVPTAMLAPCVALGSLVFLALLGAVAARAGGAGMPAGALRVTFWGAIAMAATAGIGALCAHVG
jgi:VIT1/CCC1 family predicted Fe2+/Mn2+ transporter